MGKPSAPPAPDYAAAAQQTAAGNAQQARIAQFGSMTNQVTPYGTVNYTPTTAAYTTTNGDQITADQYNAMKAANDQANANGEWWNVQDLSQYQPLTQWTQTVTMTPAEQAMFNQNQAINQQLGNVAQTGIGYVQNAMANPLKAQALASTPQSTANQMVTGVNLPNYQMSLPNAGQIQSNIAGAGNISSNANLQTGVPNAGQIQSNIGNAGNIASSIGGLGSIQSGISPAGAIGSQIANAGDVTKGFYNPSDIATATGANQVARGFTPNKDRKSTR